MYQFEIGEWKKGSARDRLAIAGDWATTILQSDIGIGLPSSTDELKPYAVGLVTCLDEAIKGTGSEFDNNETCEWALLCAAMMGYTR